MRTGFTIPNRPLLGLVAALATAAGMAALPASSASASAQLSSVASPLMSLAAGSTTSTLVSQSTIAGGDAVDTWSNGSDTVTVAGPPGTTVSTDTADGPTGYSEATVTLPDPKAGGVSAKQAIRNYAKSGQSVYQEALAVGLTQQQAQNVAAGVVSSATILGSACASSTGDGGNATQRGCVVQTLMYANGGDWYIGNTISYTGHDGHYALREAQAYDTYYPGNSVVEWNPQGSRSVGNCTTVTYGVSWSVVTVSASGTICPGTIIPLFPHLSNGTDEHGFGTQWTGSSIDYLGLPAASVEHNPPGVSDYTVMHVYMVW